MGAEDLADRVARRFTAAERIAARFFEERYAKVMLAMSEPDAKRILGFPASAKPTKEEISKAYKAKVFENHPDRGGDLKKMVDVNVAKDFLDKHGPGGGGGAGDWVKDWYKNSPGGNPTEGRPRHEQAPKWQDDPDTKIVEGGDFAKAWSSSGAPPGTEWKFVSGPVYAYNGGYNAGIFYTLYGQTDTKHVFLCFKHLRETGGTIPTKEHGPKTHFNEDWQSSEIDVSIKLDPLRAIPKNIRSVSTGWPDPAPKHPLKFIAWPGGHPTEAILDKLLHRGGVPLKDILVGTGVVKDTDSGVSGRKTQVEIVTLFNDEKSKAARAALRAGQIKNMSMIDQYDFILRVNGKEASLDQATVRKIVPWAVAWDKIDDKRVINLSKLRGGTFSGGAAYVIRKLADSLHTEPSWVHIALEKAAEEYEVETKTALMELRAGTTLFEAAYLEGISPHELFLRLHG